MAAKKKKLHFPANMFARHKPGSTHRMFGVPISEKLPRTFMQAVVDAPRDSRVKNPTQIGKPEIKATRLAQKRANGVLNAIRLGSKQK